MVLEPSGFWTHLYASLWYPRVFMYVYIYYYLLYWKVKQNLKDLIYFKISYYL